MNHRCQCYAPILYYDELSPQARSCYMLIKMLDIDVELQHINLVNGEHLTDAYNRINPSSTVPTLVDGKFVLYDSHTIMIYLCDKYFCAYQAQLCPQRYLPRLLLLNILFYEGCVLYRRYSHLVTDILTDKYSNFDIKYHQNKITDCYSTLNSFLMGHCFMVGNCITIADLSIVSTVSALDLVFPINQNFWPNLYTWFMCLKNMPWYTYNAEGVAKQRQLLERVGQFPFPSPQHIREIMPRQNSFNPKSATKDKNIYKKKRFELQSSRSDSRTENRTVARDAELKISKSRISVLLKDNEKDESTDDDLSIEGELQQDVYFKELRDESPEEIEVYIDEEPTTQQKLKAQQKKKAYTKKESPSTSKDFQSKYSKSRGQKSKSSIRQDVVDEANKDVIIIKSPKSKQSMSQESADEIEEEAVPTYPSKHSVLQEPVKYKERNLELEDKERDVLPSKTESNILHPKEEVTEVEEEFSVEEEDEYEEKEDTELEISKKYDYSSTQLSNKESIPDQQLSHSKLPITKSNIFMEKKIKKSDETETKENLNLFDATTTKDGTNESLSSPCKRMSCACLGDVKESVKEIKNLLTKHSEERPCVDLSDDSSNGGSLTIKLSDANFNNTNIKCFQFKCILSPNGCTLDRYAEVVKQLKQELCHKCDCNADRNDTSAKDSGASSQPLETNLNNEDSLYKGQRMASGADNNHIQNELQNEGLLCNCEECTANMKKVAFCPCVVNKNSIFKMDHNNNDYNNECHCTNSINRDVRADVKLYICDDDNGNLENYTENYLKYMKCALNQTFNTLNSSCMIEEMPKINPDIPQELIVLEEDDRLSNNSESEKQLKSIENEAGETELLSLRDKKESFKQGDAKSRLISKVPVYKNYSRLTADSYLKLKNVSQRKSLKSAKKAQSSSQKLKESEKIQSRKELERKNSTLSSKSIQETLTSDKNSTSSKSSLNSKCLKNECQGKFPLQQEYENAQFTVNARPNTVRNIDKSENYFSIIKLINDKDKRLGSLSVPSKIPKLIKRPECCSNECFQKKGLPLLSHTCSKGKLGRNLKKCATYKNISSINNKHGSNVPDVTEVGEVRFSGGSSNCPDWDGPSTSKCQTKNSSNTISEKEKKLLSNRIKKVNPKSVYRCYHSLGNKVNGEVESQRRSTADLEVLNCPEESANINDNLCKNRSTKSYIRETTIKKVTKQKTIPSSKKKMNIVTLPTSSKKIEKLSKRQLKPVNAAKDPGASTKNFCRKPAVTITPPSTRLKTTHTQIFRNSSIERDHKINPTGTINSNILAYYKYHSKSFLNSMEFQLNQNLSQYLCITPLQPLNSNHPEDNKPTSDSKYIPQGRLRAGSCNRKSKENNSSTYQSIQSTNLHQSPQNIETKIKSNCCRPINCYACNCVECQKGLRRPLFQYTIISGMFPLNLKDPIYKLQAMQRPDNCL